MHFLRPKGCVLLTLYGIHAKQTSNRPRCKYKNTMCEEKLTLKAGNVLPVAPGEWIKLCLWKETFRNGTNMEFHNNCLITTIMRCCIVAVGVTLTYL